MKKIKFRAWDEINKKMLNWEDELNRGSICLGRLFSYPEQYKLMQYTGFQFLGTDIYEGDILACEGGYEGDECEQPSIVYFNEEDLQYKTKCVCGCGAYPLYEYDIYKIIGNIYKNPELIK